MPGMNQLDRLETLAERLIEGAFQRLFRSRLHPAELARHLALAIERGGQAGQIPHRYEISLHPADYEALANQPAVLSDLRQYVDRLIQAGEYRPPDSLQVSLNKSDRLLPGQIEIKTE